MQKAKTLQQLLHNHDITAQQFLCTPNISSQIRSQLPKFIKYCHRHRPFALGMVRLAFDLSYSQLEDQAIKRASFTSNQVFGNQEPQIAQLFFEPPPPEEEDSGEIKEQIPESIQSQAERLFNFDSDEETTKAEQQRPIQVTREELVSLSLQILRNPDKNQTCLGHLQKMYSFFIRHEPAPVLGYFQSHPQKLQLLIKNISFSSCSSLLAQLLTCEDKKKQYKYEPLKRQILDMIIEQIFLNMQNEYFFDGAAIFLDQILNATKQSYFECFQDFKRISKYLVSAPVLARCFQELAKVEQVSFCNASRFMELICNRINSQNQDSRYYQKEDNEPTMTFEIQLFVQNIWNLLQLVPRAHHFNSITKIHFLSFLQALIATPQLKQAALSVLHPSFTLLLNAYKLNTSGGISKNKLYQIIKEIFSRASEDDIQQFIQSHPDIYEQYFTTIKAANYSNTRHYNKNECSGFDVDLIAKMTRKEEERLQKASKVVGKDLKRICKKNQTKIASYQNSNVFSLQEEFSFCGFDLSKVNGDREGSGLTVGRNNISIPVLHLPDRYHNANSKQQDGPRTVQGQGAGSGSPDLSPTDLPQSPQEIIEEEEEVVVLTNKLREDKVINLTEVLNTDLTEVLNTDLTEVLNTDLPQSQNNSEKVPLNSPVKQQTKQELSQPPQVQKKLELDEIGEDIKEEVKMGIFQRARFYARHLNIFA